MANAFTNINKDNSSLNNIVRFNGFYDNTYKENFVNGNAFVFVTKPLLFIDPIKPKSTDNKAMLAYLNMTKDPIFTPYLASEATNPLDRKLAEILSYNTSSSYSKSNFLPMFTNECKNFDSNDTIIEQADFFDTKEGYRQPLPTTKTTSEAANSVSISITEDANLDFTKLLILWGTYIADITKGILDANPDMILNGALDYMCSIYYFVLEPDGRTLKYWSKYTGCWPTTIPYGNLKYSKGQNDVLEFDVSFSYTIKEDMNPRILEDFNITSLKLNEYGKLPTNDVQGFYSSIKDSPLLNRNEMLQLGNQVGVLLKSEERDPLVFYRKGNNTGVNADSTNDRYELVFDDNGYQSEFIKSTFGSDNYYINDVASTNFAKNGNESSSWQTNAFWKTEE